MRTQYLGDEKDAFKWDYHHFLSRKLRFSALKIVLMFTEDASSDPKNFKGADESVYALCMALKKSKKSRYKPSESLDLLETQLKRTALEYSVFFHKKHVVFTHLSRRDYFNGLKAEKNEIVFFDPNTGFEPSKKATTDHICYTEIESVYDQSHKESLFSVIQFSRREKLEVTYREIKKRLPVGNFSTAIHWKNKLMFVVFGKSSELIETVGRLNVKYKKARRCVGIVQ